MLHVLYRCIRLWVKPSTWGLIRGCSLAAFNSLACLTVVHKWGPNTWPPFHIMICMFKSCIALCSRRADTATPSHTQEKGGEKYTLYVRITSSQFNFTAWARQGANRLQQTPISRTARVQPKEVGLGAGKCRTWHNPSWLLLKIQTKGSLPKQSLQIQAHLQQKWGGA